MKNQFIKLSQKGHPIIVSTRNLDHVTPVTEGERFEAGQRARLGFEEAPLCVTELFVDQDVTEVFWALSNKCV